MHHPSEWLRFDEQEKLWEYFTSNKLPVDLILHGHIHESRIGGRIDLDSFLLSLVTGTTYEIGEKTDYNNAFINCRLAFYTINIDEKNIQGYLFTTREIDKKRKGYNSNSQRP